MKKPITWRLLVLIAGTLLGLLAGLGLSAPATAAPAVSASAGYDLRDYGPDLTLDVKRNGKFVVEGENYDAKKVYVKVVKINGKDKKVADRIVRTHDGDFKWTGKKLRCGNTYQAFSYDKKDGWEKSNKIKVRCSD